MTVRDIINITTLGENDCINIYDLDGCHLFASLYNTITHGNIETFLGYEVKEIKTGCGALSVHIDFTIETVRDFIETASDSCTVEIIDDGEIVATADGKDTIPEKYLDRKIKSLNDSNPYIVTIEV